MKLFLIFIFIFVSCIQENPNELNTVSEVKELTDLQIVEGGSLDIIDLTSLSINFKDLTKVTYNCFYDTQINNSVVKTNKCSDLDGVEFYQELGILIWNPEILFGHDEIFFEILIIASDGHSEEQDIFTLLIEDHNLPPYISNVSNIIASENELISISSEFFDKNTFDYRDVDGDRIFYECHYYNDSKELVNCSNLEILFNSVNANFEWRAPYHEGHESREYEFVITGTDGFLEDSVKFKIIVSDTQRDPLISSTNNQIVFEGESIDEIDFYDLNTFNDLDLDSDLLSYTCYYDETIDLTVDETKKCNELFINFNSRDGVFNWVPSYDLVSSDSKDFEFKVSATDGNSTSETIFSIKVLNKYQHSFIDISSGELHTCAIKSDGIIYCWGRNDSGQLGVGDTIDRKRPVKVNFSRFIEKDASLVFQKVKSAEASTCALSNRNEIYCWGYNIDARLGDGTNENSNIPIKVDASNLTQNESFKDFDILGGHVCGLTNLGNLYCWGSNSFGQLGDNDTKLIPTTQYSNEFNNLIFKSVATGYLFTCGLSNEGKLYCWGRNIYGELGVDISTAESINPILVSNSIFTQISAGNAFSCSIKDDGDVYCLGANNLFQMANDNTIVNSFTPIKWDTTNTGSNLAKLISSFFYHTCTISNEGKVYCWGRNDYGQLGNNDTTDSIPVASNIENVKKVSAGKLHSCALNNYGQIYCWGNNEYGQLGDGTNTNNLSPTLVDYSIYNSEKNKFIKVESGNEFSCALTSIGLVYCWGDNEYGQLGNGSNESSSNPLRVVDLNNEPIYFKDLALGDKHACAIALDSKTYCWGKNDVGQLGDSTFVNQMNPTLVTNSLTHGVEKIIVKNNVTCGIALNGKAFCTGSNENGKLGINTDDFSINTLTQFNDDTIKYSNLFIGKNNVCGLSAGGVAYCAGDNSLGQLGNKRDSDNDGVKDLLFSASPIEISMSEFNSDQYFIDMAIGNDHICALSAKGRVYCWGDNSKYQNGKKTGVIFETPTQTTWFLDYSFNRIFAYQYNTCALNFNGLEYCWGNEKYLPQEQIQGPYLDTTFKQISIGADHKCSLTYGGDIYCLGENIKGQLGKENYSNSVLPLKLEL